MFSHQVDKIKFERFSDILFSLFEITFYRNKKKKKKKKQLEVI